MRKYGPWSILSTREVYKDPWLKVVRDEVLRPDGKPGSYATVRIKSGVCVLAVDSSQQIRLTKEFHYAVGRVTVEGVSGGIEAGETPLGAAQRELAEELGLQAERWEHFATIDPFTASVYSRVDIFVAQGLTDCPPNPEGTELIEAVTLDLDSAVAMIRSGEISHGPTCVGLLHLALARVSGPLQDS